MEGAQLMPDELESSSLLTTSEWECVAAFNRFRSQGVVHA